MQAVAEHGRKVGVEQEWSNPSVYSGVPREIIGKTYSLVNVPVQVWEQIRDFMTPPLAEPKEFGVMVEASKDFGNGVDCYRGKWIRIFDARGWYWQSDMGHHSLWSELINPKVVAK